MKIRLSWLPVGLSTLLITMLLSFAPVGDLVAQSAQPGATRNGPDCSGGWPTDMTFVLLKNAGITDNDKVDFSKTKTVRLASEKIGQDLYHQVYDVVYTEHSGRTIEAIAVHNASNEECSITGVKLFLVSQHLSSEDK